MKVRIRKKLKKWLSLSLAAMLMTSVVSWSTDVVLASEISDVSEAAENEETETATSEDLKTGLTETETEEDTAEKEDSEAGEDVQKEGDSEEAEVPEVAESVAEGEEQEESIEDIEDIEVVQELEAADVSGNQEALQEVPEDEVMPYAGDIIASGTDGGITWTIDTDGKLTVSGSGDFSSSLWADYKESVISAEVNVTGMASTYEMFYECTSLVSVDLSGLNTENVTDMSWMFSGCSSLESLDLSRFDTRNVTDMSLMFSGCSSLESLDLSSFNTGNVTDMHWMFSSCSSLTSLDLRGFDTGNVTDMSVMFHGCSNLASLDLRGFDTGNVTDMSDMFGDCNSLVSLDLSSFDTRNVTNMSCMFMGCGSLTSLDLSSFDTGNVTDMGDMFLDCSSLTSLDLSSFNTGNVTAMSDMFSGCSSLANLDLSGFNTGNVTDMSGMFSHCSSLTSLDLRGFDTGNVTDMWYMFFVCSSLASLDLSSFDTENVTDMCGMFFDCINLASLDLSSFDTRNVTNMASMFGYCISITSLDLSKFDMRSVGNTEDMLFGCNELTTINAPLNLTQSVETPVVAGTVWRLPDGTEITELPQNLSSSVIVTRHNNPKIITTTTELNMEDVVRVKYVPYSYTVRTDNADEENKVTFSLEAGELPRGLEIYPATGEIYGVPLEAGEFPITVKASYSNPDYEPSYANITVIVKDNTDSDVYNASDKGYELIVPVGERAEDGSNVFLLKQKGDQLFVSAGEFREFIDLWLNGERLVDGVDYTKESGSTRITIRSQTFANKANQNGINTLAMEFRVGGDKSKELKRTAQNFRIDSSQNNSSNGGHNSGNGNGSNSESGNSQNSGSGNRNDIPSAVVDQEEESTAETVIYTVVSGDTLWKIAKKFYGDGSFWQKIYMDNMSIIRDPNKIYVGQVLTIYLSKGDGSIITSPDAVDVESGYYIVKKGDTLWTISKKVYGNGKNWKKVYDANRDKIKKPEQIYAGQILVIPEN
ncbi:MAG: BspA family leucine-rich repeat surface protein [Lachnospiraceae bacterium]|nr:BspA family leucine-rich repeat surface protein [Lachnospiraceae bacterium]